MCDGAHTPDRELPATVQRLLTKRKQIVLLAIAVLAFPAAALAANDAENGPAAPGVGQAEVALAPLQRPVDKFNDLVDHVAEQIRTAERERVERKQREHREAFEELPGGVSMETLEAIAECESGGDPTVVSSDGSYQGKYQFSFSTWETVGGSGDPAAAPEMEQDYRAALLYAQSGSSPWPVCG
jgi:TolA-binding protein